MTDIKIPVGRVAWQFATPRHQGSRESKGNLPRRTRRITVAVLRTTRALVQIWVDWDPIPELQVEASKPIECLTRQLVVQANL